MSNSGIKRFTMDELRERAQLEQAIADDPDWADIPKNWYEQAEAVMPKPKVPVSIRLDADVIEYFRSTGRGWQTRVNAILRAYRDIRHLPASSGKQVGTRRKVKAT